MHLSTQKDREPDASGLSESNIRYAKRFYALYSEAIGNLQQVAEESEDKLIQTPSISNPQQVAEEFDSAFAQNVISDLCHVPWGHHMAIIDKAKGEKWLLVKRIFMADKARDLTRLFNLSPDEEDRVANFKDALDNLKIEFTEMTGFDYNEATKVLSKSTIFASDSNL
jgi:hypothetical protein